MYQDIQIQFLSFNLIVIMLSSLCFKTINMRWGDDDVSLFILPRIDSLRINGKRFNLTLSLCMGKSLNEVKHDAHLT